MGKLQLASFAERTDGGFYGFDHQDIDVLHELASFMKS